MEASLSFFSKLENSKFYIDTAESETMENDYKLNRNKCSN